MEQLLIQSNAREHFLQASSREVNILIPFSGEPMEVCTARGNGAELEVLNATVQDLEPGGGTDMYAAALQGLEELKNYDLSQYTPALILLTDGQSEGSYQAFANAYQELGAQVPVFSIMFGTRTRASWKTWRSSPTREFSTAGRTWWGPSAA